MCLPTVASLVAVIGVGSFNQAGEHRRCLLVVGRLIRLVDLDSAVPQLGQGPWGRRLAKQMVIARELAPYGINRRQLLRRIWCEDPVPANQVGNVDAEDGC